MSDNERLQEYFAAKGYGDFESHKMANQAEKRIEAERSKGVMPSEIRLMFEQWWILEGQFKCASGQPSQKETVFTAWISGWDCLNRYIEARSALAKAKSPTITPHPSDQRAP